MTASSPVEHPTIDSLLQRWQRYLETRRMEDFVDFTLTLNNLGARFGELRLPGLTRLCEGLENAAVARIDAEHPLPDSEIRALQRQIDTLQGALGGVTANVKPEERRQASDKTTLTGWVPPRGVRLFVADGMDETAANIERQLRFIGFDVLASAWSESPDPPRTANLAVIFLPAPGQSPEEAHAFIRAMRERYRVSQLFYVGVSEDMEHMVGLMRAGIDVTIPLGEPLSTLITQVINLVEDAEKPSYRVLVVDDSKTTSVSIQRTLREHGIDTRAVIDPGRLLGEIADYQPDLVLMDMMMPNFDGVEATRVLRQLRSYKSLPVVYLSSEMDVGKQMDALRLGGDQFLSKPCNPIVLSAVVKTKIERYREMLRTTQIDGLTGLLNHTASKSRLDTLIAMSGGAELAVVMIDIDHFKSINDTHGHPVGDLVIRSLAWLLKGRLRARDVIGRYGGEEFIVALPETSAAMAVAVIDSIRAAFSALPHVAEDDTIYATFSAGIASLRVHPDATTLTRAADQALLEAKRRGRNCVVNADG